MFTGQKLFLKEAPPLNEKYLHQFRSLGNCPPTPPLS